MSDLESFLGQSGSINGIECASENIVDEAYIFLKLFVQLYADDTVLLADSSDYLQNALNSYATYCKIWKLTINNSKTKVLIFSKGRRPNFTFKLDDEEVEIVSEYKYLGILFNRSGSFLSAKKHIANQATRNASYFENLTSNVHIKWLNNV